MRARGLRGLWGVLFLWSEGSLIGFSCGALDVAWHDRYNGRRGLLANRGLLGICEGTNVVGPVVVLNVTSSLPWKTEEQCMCM